MTFHTIKQYLIYTWRAKGRHGIHSPFVYEFIERVLLDKGPIKRQFIVECPDIPLKYENLVSRICQYYDYSLIVRFSGDTKANIAADILLVNGADVPLLPEIMDRYVSSLDIGGVIVTGIHQSVATTDSWTKICGNEKVRMSIDLFGIGILFFKNEFKVSQHFVLKY